MSIPAELLAEISRVPNALEMQKECDPEGGPGRMPPDWQPHLPSPRQAPTPSRIPGPRGGAPLVGCLEAVPNLPSHFPVHLTSRFASAFTDTGRVQATPLLPGISQWLMHNPGRGAVLLQSASPVKGPFRWLDGGALGGPPCLRETTTAHPGTGWSVTDLGGGRGPGTIRLACPTNPPPPGGIPAYLTRSSGSGELLTHFVYLPMPDGTDDALWHFGDPLVQPDYTGGADVHCFWWGFHIIVPERQMESLRASGWMVNTLLDNIASIAGPAAPFIRGYSMGFSAMIAAADAMDQAHKKGIYLNMSWFAPLVFVPTPIVSDPP